MEFQDKVLTCIDCGADFVFTAGEQLFFYDKQFKNEPKRCKTCKSKRVAVLTAPPPRDAHHYTRRPPSPSAPRRAGPSSAANASRRRNPSPPPDPARFPALLKAH